MKHLDLFAGIGGFSIAADWTWPHVEHIFVEIDPFCQKVLKKHWPESEIHSDIKKYHPSRTVDLITGGFPCQPFSVAGKQQGKTDDRYLWPEMLRVIQKARPTWIIAENVTGIIEMALDEVLASLEDSDYETETFIIPACGIDAPHRRDRVWIIANASGERRQQKPEGAFSYESQNERRTSQNNNVIASMGENVADAESNNERRSRTFPRRQQSEVGRRSSQSGQNVSNSKIPRLEGENSKGNARTNGWNLQCLGRDWWATEPAVGELVNGISGRLVRFEGRTATGVDNRVNKLRALGNSIVPQVAATIMQAIKEIES